MSMKQAILDFSEQFKYEPQIENAENFVVKQKFLLSGMGGSHLAGDILKGLEPSLDIIIHRDYDLPDISDLADRLVIASSYSGNTEEVVSGLKTAIENGLSAVVVATGGQLIELAQEHGTPYIIMPSTGIQPRSALAFSFLALLKIIGNDQLIEQAQRLVSIIHPEDLENEGKKLADDLKGRVPIIYSSEKNHSVAYNWKIKFNETGKIPAFCNVFPELNHNEMTGFDVADSTRGLSEKFHFIILRDDGDHARIQKRMQVLQRQYQERGLFVTEVSMKGKTRLEKIFVSLLIADWAAFHIADGYGLESDEVPMVEDFKRLLKE